MFPSQPQVKARRSGSYDNFVAVDGTVLDDVVNFGPVFIQGDINGDGNVGLYDAVLGLQALARIEFPAVNRGADVNDDDKIGLAEVLYVLQHVSGLR